MRSIDMKLVIIIMLITVVGLFAQVPRTLSYQGKLTNPGGNVITTPVNITFRIFNVVSGGTALWTETHSSVPVTNGFFDVTLGESTPITLDFDTQYWIEVQVGSETLTPREKMTSMPYAHRATYTDTAGYVIDGVDITGIDQGHHIYKGAGTSDIEQSVIYEEGGQIAIGDNEIPTGSVTASVVNQYTANFASFQLLSYYGGTSTPTGQILSKIARGTKASPSALLADDIMVGFAARGHDGTDWTSAQITMLGRAEENWEPGKYGTYWAFGTTESGTAIRNEKLRITGSGNVGIGTDSPQANLHVTNHSGSQVTEILESYSTTSAQLKFRRAGGTVLLPEPLDSGVIISNIGSAGWNGVSFANSANIRVLADENLTSTAYGTRMDFRVTKRGTSSLIYPLTLTSDERVGIFNQEPEKVLDVYSNNTSDYIRLSVAGDATTGIDATGILLLERRDNAMGYIGFRNNHTLSNQDMVLSVRTGASAPFTWHQYLRYIVDDGYLILNQNGGNVGIGTFTPSAELEVAGQVKITGGTPGTGKVLTSDADGLATWETPSGGGIPSGAYVAFPDSSARTGWTYTGYYGSSGSGDSWLIRASMPTARRSIAAAAVGGKVYVLGGYGPLSLNEEYDPATNSWTTKTSMPTARYDLVAVAINNKIYAIGGYPATTTNEEYDPATDTWTTKASGSFAMRASAGAAANGRIYVMGGDIAPVSFYNQEYNPATNSWALKTILPTARTRLASATVDNKVYLIGGALDIVGSATNLTLNQQYDPVTDSWTTKASMPTARRYLTATTVNNKIYAIGGYDQNGVGYISSNEEYNPATNTWATKSSMPLARQQHAAAETGGKIYAMGGTASSGVTAINYQYTPPGLDFYWFQKD